MRLKILWAMVKAWGPLIRITPIPPAPKGVEMAAMVSPKVPLFMEIFFRTDHDPPEKTSSGGTCAQGFILLEG